ncbi:dTDP-4-dehydrorhamnose 3,5-epimerase [Bacteroidales bacterium OttesenSCG-928-I14]|nr:dTDP-4-dehydrorhamnose 3,5-epimerase [Bacteroidales bacterium OttesenSCG-928-I14]
MNYIETAISGLWILEPKVFIDSRGYFMESYKKADFQKEIGQVDFIQDNESKSSYGVLRGLHYQEGDAAQAKLVRVIQGRVLDIAVDIRKGSPTFGKYEIVELSESNKRQLFVPRGFAHGFLVMSETAIFSYKVDNVYNPSMERTLNCMDKDLDIRLPIDSSELIMSEKDKKGVNLKSLL